MNIRKGNLVFFQRDKSKPQSVSLDNEWATFNFERFLHRDKRDIYRLCCEKDRYFPADFAASVVAALHSGQYLAKVTSRMAVDCCITILEDLGYLQSASKNIATSLAPFRSTPENVILVPGNQNPGISQMRVEGAHLFLKALNIQPPYTLIFSGRNPNPEGEDSVRVRSEALRMTATFEELRTRKDFPGEYIYEEQESRNTKDNVSATIKYLKSRDFDLGHCSLCIVSSTFHLIRLVLAIERCQQLEGESFQQVVLVGTENRGTQFYHDEKHSEYMKLMFFDLIDYFLNSKQYSFLHHGFGRCLSDRAQEKGHVKSPHAYLRTEDQLPLDRV